MTYKDYYEKAVDEIKRSGSAEPESDAWLLFEDTFGVSRSRYFLVKEEEISADDTENAKLFEERCQRRIKGEPVQYILGTQEFCGLKFNVDKRVLIPRLDTEVLVEEVLKCDTAGKSILDLCTGSGCILIAAMKLGGFAHGTGTDISQEALEVAKENAALNDADVRFYKGDLFGAVGADEKYDFITANPPYISPDEKDEVQNQVIMYEPYGALFAGHNGLIMYERIIKDAAAHLNEGGRLFFEIGCSQGKAVSMLLWQAGFKEVRVIKDLAGLDRVAMACK